MIGKPDFHFEASEKGLNSKAAGQMALWRRVWLKYALAVAVTVAAFFIRRALDSWIGSDRPVLILFEIPVVVSAYLGGMGPAFLSTFLIGIGVPYFVLPPVFSWSMERPVDLMQWAIMLSCGAFISIISGMMYRSKQRAVANEGMLAATIASIGDGIITTNTTGHITFLNGEAERLTGLMCKEAVGRPLDEVFRIVDQETGKAVKDWTKGTPYLGASEKPLKRHMLLARDGREIPIDERCSTIKLADGAVNGSVLVFSDRSVQARAEKDLLDSELRLRTTLQTANEGFWLIDNDTITMDVNPRMCAILGRNREEVLGRKIFDFVDNENRPIFDQQIGLRERGEAGTYEIALSRPDGSNVFCQLNSTPLFDGSGNKVGSFAMVTDITERKQAEKSLSRRESYLTAIIENLPGLVWLKDTESRFLAVNNTFARSCGKEKPEDILGKTDLDIWPKELAEKYRADDKEVITRGVPTVVEEPISEQGVRTWFETFKTPVFNVDGQVLGTSGYARDITERKRAEEERTRLATAIEQAAEAIFITAPDWIILYVNPAFEHLTGYDNREIIGQHTRILRSYQHNDAFYKNMRDALTRAEVWSGRIINKKKDGTFYDAEATVSPVRDKSGAIINYVSIHRDITREVRLEAELHQARKMEAIGLLAAGIAHDFNNILAAIMGFTELSLFKIPEDSPVRRNLEQVLKAASRASGVVKQILTFTRQGVQERRPVRIAPIAQEALKLLRSSLPSTIEIRQEVAVRPGEDVVLADPVQIHQVLMNLSTNAGHAMRAKGGTLTVKLSVIADVSRLLVHPDLKAGPHVCITVSDTGHGMDSVVLERIFDPYFTTKGPGEGTGLGLSVVQGIVKSHGGAITVRSAPGHGTTFSVFLPRLEEVDAADAKALGAPPTGSERILFVDDEEALVELGKEMLETLGYHVTAKTSSPDALEIFRAQPDAFDLVITDMTMPFLTGRELAKEIIALRPDTPIILSTGFSDLVNEKQAKEAGIREFVMKPYEIRTLARTIRRVFE